jgi:hypothetical protein
MGGDSYLAAEKKSRAAVPLISPRAALPGGFRRHGHSVVKAAAALTTGNYHCERRKVRQVTLEKYPPRAGHFRYLGLVRRDAFLLAKTHTSSVSAPRADWQIAQ